MRPRDHNILARELKQQLLPCRCSRNRVNVEDHCEFGMLQLDALCMHGVAPKQDLLSLRRKLISGMSWGMARQRDELHAISDRLGTSKRAPHAGLDVWRCDGLRTLEEPLSVLWRLGSDFRRQPKAPFRFRHVDICVSKRTLFVLSGQ